MNYPIWDPGMSGGLLIALVAVTHVFVSHFAVGGGLFLVVAERRAYRTNDAAMLAWLERHSKFFALLTLVFGAVTGVGIWFAIGLLHPAATSALIHIFVWGWAIEWVFFVVEIAAAILYVVSWRRVDRKTHLALGWVYFAAAFMSLVVINGILSFMLTPGRWLETRTFADGFFNPTYWPSLVVRTLGAVAFAGLYVFITAWREEPALRVRLARYAAWWALPATVVGPAAAWWYFRAAQGGALAAVQGGLTTAVHSFRLVLASAVAYVLLLAAVVALAKRAPRLVSLPVGIVLLVLGYASIGGAEFVRESIRKPYVLGNPAAGYLYVNGLTPAEVEATQKGGLLATAKWVARDPVRSAAGDAAPGAQVFRLACSGCHTLDGYRGVRSYVDGRTVRAIAIDLGRLGELRGRMPSFPGDDEERELLALYLAGLDGVVEPEPAAPAVDLLARGKQVLDDHCMGCHADLPLAPRVAGWSAAIAYEKLGKLSALSSDMPDFSGTDDERKALASYLATLGASKGGER